MKKSYIKIVLILFILVGLTLVVIRANQTTEVKNPITSEKNSHWFLLHRKSNVEYLYKGVPGDISNSKLVKKFNVKSGVPGQKPTPLPKLLGRNYWVITEKHEELDNPETAPYFITLNIPAPSHPPYGPVPYIECGGQCDWEKEGNFGLHGIGDNPSRLEKSDQGSSGCIRHSVEDITYLYNLLEPNKEEIRYYIEDV